MPLWRKKRVYLASGFNRRWALRLLANALEKKGIEVCSRWIWIENRPDREDGDWEGFAEVIAESNLYDLQRADILVIDAKGIRETNKGGVHSELGFFLAKKRPIYLIGERSNTFHWLPQVKQINYQQLVEELNA